MATATRNDVHDDPFAAAAAGLRAPRRPPRQRRNSGPVATVDTVEPFGELTLTLAEPAADRHPRGTDMAGDAASALAAAVAAIVAPFGVPEPRQRDAVVDAVSAFLAANGTDADIVSLRYGVLTLAAPAAQVRFVRCDADRIAELCSGAGFALRDVRVRTRR